MAVRIVETIKQAIAYGGTNPALATLYQGGQWAALQGIEELEAVVNAAFDAASTLTSMSFRLVVSDDQVNVDPLVTIDALSTAAASVDHTFNASAGNSVRGRLQVAQASLQQARLAAFFRIETKYTGGAPRSGDIATGRMNYAHSV